LLHHSALQFLIVGLGEFGLAASTEDALDEYEYEEDDEESHDEDGDADADDHSDVEVVLVNVAHTRTLVAGVAYHHLPAHTHGHCIPTHQGRI